MVAPHSRIPRLPAVLKSPWQRYALAVAAFAFSFLVRYLLYGHLYGDRGYTVFIPAIILTTLLAGVGPAILTTVLSGAANWYAFMSPVFQAHSAVALAMYATTAIIVISLSYWLRLTIDRLASEMASKTTLAERQSSLFRLADQLHRAETEEQVLDAALDGIIAALHCDRASILLRDAAGVMRFVRWRGLSDAYRNAVEGHSPWAVDEADPRPVRIDDIDHAKAPDPLKQAVKAEKLRALAFIPLTSDGKLLGKFMAYFDSPHAFSNDEIEVATAIAQQLRLVIQKKRSEEREKLLIHELRHRTRNMFSVVQALAHQSLRGDGPPNEARDKFIGRLRTLARADERLAAVAWHGTKLDEVVRCELEPFAGRFEICGEEIYLNPQATQNFALAVHELATNASKYGALSVDIGKVMVGWTNGGTSLEFRWEERDGPPVSAPTRSGFGGTLLKATLGDGRTSFAKTGFIYEVVVPLATITA
jgi:two-component sensor histidine kinase